MHHMFVVILSISFTGYIIFCISSEIIFCLSVCVCFRIQMHMTVSSYGPLNSQNPPTVKCPAI